MMVPSNYDFTKLFVVAAALLGVPRVSGQEAQPSLGVRAYEHLVQLTKDGHGNPNPRVSCTEGYHHAIMYVSQVMNQTGLIPLGTASKDDEPSFQFNVPGSVDATFCPNGMINVIGLVQGASLPDEYILFSAHVDGPNNQNPQTQKTRGNQDTANAYDDGAAVAVGLALAERLVTDPPARSVVFLFTDGEEGWGNVGTPPLGESTVCPQFLQTDWFQTMPVNLAYFQNVEQQVPSCENFGIGFAAWVQNPTVNLSAVKAAYFADPLGAPPNGTAQLAAIGGEMSSLLSSDGGRGETMNDFLDTVWPANSGGLTLSKVPRKAITASYSDMDGVTLELKGFCGSTQSCIADQAGIPSVWLAEPAFQKYHGGMNIDLIRNLFDELYQQGGNNQTKFPGTAYFSLDTLDIVNQDNLDTLAGVMYQLLVNTANSDTVSQLSYDYPGTVAYNYTDTDADNLIAALANLLNKQLPKFPQDVVVAFTVTINSMVAQLQQILPGLSVGDQASQSAMAVLAPAAVGLFMAIDFFYVAYPDKEAYADQFVTTKQTAPETEAPDEATNGQEDDPIDISGGAQSDVAEEGDSTGNEESTTIEAANGSRGVGASSDLLAMITFSSFLALCT